MVDSTFNLGRSVPTAREVLEVIRPDLRLAALIGPMLQSVLARVPAPADPAQPDAPIVYVMEGGDHEAFDAVFDALREDALRNVKDWAGDLGKVYDGDKLRGFVAAALNEVCNGEPSDAVLDVLALDDGACEDIGTTLAKLAGKSEAPLVPVDADLEGMAARYFQRV
jgi:hypothetical protein